MTRDPDSVLMQEIDERHNLSQQVFFRREERGWTQTELATRCGTTQAQIANIEAGNVNPTLHTLVRLAHIFGCLAHDLLRPAIAKIPIEELLKLSVAERIELVGDLWDSVAAEPEGLELTEAQKEELERRLAEHRADPAPAVPWQEVRERLYKKYG